MSSETALPQAVQELIDREDAQANYLGWDYDVREGMRRVALAALEGRAQAPAPGVMSSTGRHWGPLGPCEPTRVVETGTRTGVQREHETTGATLTETEAEIARLTTEVGQLRAALVRTRATMGYLPGVDPALLSDGEPAPASSGPAVLVDALERFGVHANDCKKWWHHQIEGRHLQADRPCTCGLADALASASPAPASEASAEMRAFAHKYAGTTMGLACGRAAARIERLQGEVTALKGQQP